MLPSNAKMVNNRMWLPRTRAPNKDAFEDYYDDLLRAGGWQRGNEGLDDLMINDPVMQGYTGDPGIVWNIANTGFDEETGAGGIEGYGPFLTPDYYELDGQPGWLLPEGREGQTAVYGQESASIWDTIIPMAATAIIGSGIASGFGQLISGPQLGADSLYDFGQPNLDALSGAQSFPVGPSGTPDLGSIGGNLDIGAQQGLDYGMNFGTLDLDALGGENLGWDYGFDAGTGTASEWAASGASAAGALGTAAAGSGLWDTVKEIGKKVPWGDVVAGGLGAYGSSQAGKDIADAMRYAVDKADPFSSQRGQYQQMLPGLLDKQQGLLDSFGQESKTQNQNFLDQYNTFKNSYNDLFGQYQNQYNQERNKFDEEFAGQYGQFRRTLDQMFSDPNYWANNSLLSGLNKNAINDTSRAMASRGYNMSGNEINAIGNRLQNNNANFAGQQQQNYTNYANSMLGNYGQTGLGSLNSLSQNNQNALGNFSNTGLNSLQQYGTNSQNYLNNLYNQSQGQANMSNQVGGWAGAGFGPGAAGLIASQGGQAAANQNNQMYGNLGTVFQSILKGF